MMLSGDWRVCAQSRVTRGVTDSGFARSHPVQRIRKFCVSCAVAAFLSGCAVLDGTTSPDLQARPEGVSPPTDFVSLQPHSPLHVLARTLDEAATARSAAVQEVRAAQARLQARHYDRFPQMRPTGSVALNHSSTASLGLSLQQVIWDGGRTSTRLGDAELGVAAAALRAWASRNEDVHEGLVAFIDISRLQARLRAYDTLDGELTALAELLDIRATGGVSDRGEALRMAVARQELQREIIQDTAALRRARTDLMRLMPSGIAIDPLPDLAQSARMCRRAWPSSEAPIDALARLSVSRSRLAEDLVRARRFPSLVLGMGAAVTNVANGITPGVNINLDASDMLGLGGARAIEAAELDSEAMLAAYQIQRETTQAELDRLEENYAESHTEFQQLRALQQANEGVISLYREQLNVGSIPLTEGIILYREVTNIKIAIINFHADVLNNCLRSAEIRGLLAPFRDFND